MAIGLALIFGVLRIVNFAHGEFYMVGAYAYTIVAARLGVPLVVALPIAFLFGAALGWLVERTLMRPLYANIGSWGLMRDEYAVIVTFGLSLLLVNLVDKAIGPYAFRAPALINASRIVVGPALMSGQKVAAAVVTLAVLALIALFLRFSYWGRAVRAVSQNRLGASLAGIDATAVSSLVFALAGGLAALAGALLSPIINASPDVGAFPAIKSYVIVVLGGMGSIPGAFIASLLLGLVESFGAVLVSYQYRDTFGLVLLILFLAFDLELRGAGAFPNPRRPRVLWLGVGKGAQQLEQLAGRLCTGLRDGGFALEEKPFRGHLTAARVRPGGERSASRALQAVPAGAIAEFKVERLCLMQSQLSPHGAKHTLVHEIRLS